MRKLLLLSLTVLFSMSAWAQNRQYNPVPERGPRLEMPEISSPRLEFDTLTPSSLADPCGQAGVVNYLSDGWGYVAGNNAFNDHGKAQRFNFTGSAGFNVQEVWGFFAAASAVGDANLTAEILSVDNTGAPDQVLGTSNPLKTSEINLDTVLVPTIFTFATPVDLTNPIFVANIDFSALYAANDTAGIWTTEDPCGSGNNAWEKWDNGNWFLYNDTNNSWGLDIDNVMGVMVEFFTTDIDDPLVNWRNLSLRPAFPNPAVDQVSINYGITEATEVEVVLYSIDGKVIQRIDKGIQTAGEYSEVVDLQNLPAGTYAYGVFTNRARLMNRFVISR